MIVATFFGIAILADGREQIRGFQELILRDAGDALHHLRRVARIMLLQQLIDAARIFERSIESDVRRQAPQVAARGRRDPQCPAAS